MVAYWQVVVALVATVSALGSLRSQDRPLSWRAVTALAAAAAILAGWPAVRRRAVVLLVPAFLTTTAACWGFQGFLPDGPPFGLFVLSPLRWQALVLVPVISVIAGFTGLRLYERQLRRGPEEAG
jgi:hypothetical protein